MALDLMAKDSTQTRKTAVKDRIFEAFLERQYAEGMALVQDSDLVKLLPLDGPPPQRYVVAFNCTGLVQLPDGEIAESDHFELGIGFPADYLRRAEPFEVLRWFGPPNV